MTDSGPADALVPRRAIAADAGAIAAAPDRQGIGLGSRLLDHAEPEARRRGLGEIRLETNERFVENLAIHARRGYRETPDSEPIWAPMWSSWRSR